MSINVERKKDTKSYSTAVCPECLEKFKLKRKWQKFCSGLCRYRKWDKDHPRIK